MIDELPTLTPDQHQADIEFNMAWDYDGPGLCRNKREEYSDYTDENTPTDDQAEKMCYGCPLLKICYDRAVLLEPTHGVWAGLVWREDDDT